MFGSLSPMDILFSITVFYFLLSLSLSIIYPNLFLVTSVSEWEKDQIYQRYSRMMLGKEFWYQHIGWLYDKNRHSDQGVKIITLSRRDYRFIDDED